MLFKALATEGHMVTLYTESMISAPPSNRPLEVFISPGTVVDVYSVAGNESAHREVPKLLIYHSSLPCFASVPAQFYRPVDGGPVLVRAEVIEDVKVKARFNLSPGKFAWVEDIPLQKKTVVDVYYISGSVFANLLVYNKLLPTFVTVPSSYFRPIGPDEAPNSRQGN